MTLLIVDMTQWCVCDLVVKQGLQSIQVSRVRNTLFVKLCIIIWINFIDMSSSGKERELYSLIHAMFFGESARHINKENLTIDRRKLRGIVSDIYAGRF